MSTTKNLMSLWMWPLEAAGNAGDLYETIANSTEVISRPAPTILAGMREAHKADHRELRMRVSEKVDACGKTAHAFDQASKAVRTTIKTNATDLRRAPAAGPFMPADWWRIGERNLKAAAARTALPAAALAPFHRGYSANARRLR